MQQLRLLKVMKILLLGGHIEYGHFLFFYNFIETSF